MIILAEAPAKQRKLLKQHLKSGRICNGTLLAMCILSLCVRPSLCACGDGLLDKNEECDDRNLMDHDGCSSKCLVEPVTIQTWYSFPDCTGKILKMIVHKNREYREPDPDPAKVCSSGKKCECPTEVPACSDGSDASFCECRAPRCASKAHQCYQWKHPENGETHGYITRCFAEFPQLTTTNELSPTGIFLINKQWRLTFSSSLSGTVTADVRAWELTRSRAIAIGLPDFWNVVAMDKCIPSWNPIDASDPAAEYSYESHSSLTLKSQRGCSDSQCQNCTIFEPTSRVVCNTSLTCQLLSPGRCFVCSGGIDLADFGVSPVSPVSLCRYLHRGRLCCCSSAPDNYLYRNSKCRIGVGCGACNPGMACGACGEKDAPLPSCGDPRKGGAPYFWINSADEKGRMHAGDTILVAA